MSLSRASSKRYTHGVFGDCAQLWEHVIFRKPVKQTENPRAIDVKFRTFDNVDENTKYAKMVRIGMLQCSGAADR
jgi:hypothetical protein